jgi:hypothetical protein
VVDQPIPTVRYLVRWQSVRSNAPSIIDPHLDEQIWQNETLSILTDHNIITTHFLLVRTMMFGSCIQATTVVPAMQLATPWSSQYARSSHERHAIASKTTEVVSDELQLRRCHRIKHAAQLQRLRRHSQDSETAHVLGKEILALVP